MAQGRYSAEVGRGGSALARPVYWYTMKVVEVQERVPAQISTYLERSWLGNMLQSARRWRQRTRCDRGT